MRVKNKKLLLLTFIILFVLMIASALYYLKPISCTYSDLKHIPILNRNERSVELHGYISPYSPSDGSFIYLMEKPYDMMPLQTTGLKYANSGVHVYPKEGSSIIYTGIPVTVRGVISVSYQQADEFGIAYDWSIIDAEVESLDSSLMNEKLYNYSAIVTNGVLDAVITSLLALDYDVNYEAYDIDCTDLQTYSTDNLSVCLGYKSLLNTAEFSALCGIIEDLGTTLNEVNEVIENKEYTRLADYKDDYYMVYKAFDDWRSQFILEV